MKKLLIVYHSVTGGARQMALAAATSAEGETSVQTVLMPAVEAQTSHLLGADGYLFVCPENLGTVSGMMKDFFDRTYYGALDRLNGRPYAIMICAGSDGHGAARQIARITLGWRLREIAPPLIVLTHAQTPEAILSPKRIGEQDLQRCRDLAGAFAGGLAISVF